MADSISPEVQALQTQVATTDTVIDSAVTLINGLAAQIAAVAGDRVASLALAAQLNEHSAALASAVAANTPAAPTPTP